jgi:3-hydroxyisobutyrate dehydrogenase
MTRPAVAVVGLGAMGVPMAARLAATCDVVGVDVDAARRALLDDEGIATAPTVAAAGARASLVVVAVRTLAQAESCLLGEDGAADALPPGAVVVLTSTVGASGARSLAERLAARGLRLLDVPVSGGPVRAGSGDLLALVGGPPELIDAARPVLDALVSTCVVVGPAVGDGQSMKIVNQLLCGVHIAAAAEALVLARGLGIEPEAALQALGAGAAASFMLGDRGPRIAQQLVGEEPEVSSRLDIFVKDLGLVAEAAELAGLTLPVAGAAEQLFRLGEARGLAGLDDSGVSLVVAGQPA